MNDLPQIVTGTHLIYLSFIIIMIIRVFLSLIQGREIIMRVRIGFVNVFHHLLFNKSSLSLFSANGRHIHHREFRLVSPLSSFSQNSSPNRLLLMQQWGTMGQSLKKKIIQGSHVVCFNFSNVAAPGEKMDIFKNHKILLKGAQVTVPCGVKKKIQKNVDLIFRLHYFSILSPFCVVR